MDKEETSFEEESVYFSVEVYRKDPDTFVAFCSELDIYSYGPTIEFAVDRLKRIVNFYIESADEMGMTLEELGLSTSEGQPMIPRVSPHNLNAAVN